MNYSGSSSSLNIGKELTPGVSPSTMLGLRNVVLGESLNSVATELQSNTITPERDIESLRNGTYAVAGAMGFEVGTNNFDLILEGLLGNVVTTGASAPYTKVYTRSSVIPTFTVERVYGGTPLTTQVYTGLKFSSAAFSFDPTSLVTCSADYIGRKSEDASTLIDDDVVALPHVPFAGIDTKVTIAGVETKALRATLNITNAVEASYVLGSQYADDVVEGKGEVTGDIELYFSDRIQYNRFKNETVFSLSFEMKRGLETITIEIPNAKFSGNRDVNIETDKALIQKFTFKGLSDPTINGAVKVTVINQQP